MRANSKEKHVRLNEARIRWLGLRCTTSRVDERSDTDDVEVVV